MKAALAGLIGTLVLGSAARAEPPPAYDAFESFCTDHFGAEKEDLVYTACGKELKFLDDGLWVYASERSACIGFETNLPARSFVEFGKTAQYGQATPQSRRHTYLHLWHLPNLEPGTQVHFRLVAVDERGHRMTSDDATLTTRRMPDAVPVPGDLDGPPYLLDKAGATYLVTEDLRIEGLAFDVTADDVTLDLGGHTVVYDDKAWGPIPSGNFWDWIRGAKYGVRAMKAHGLSVVNGTLRQGRGNDAAQANSIGYNPIYANGCRRMEIAGLRIVYSGPQQIGLYHHWPGEDCRIHHNVFRDLGTEVVNRHGAGCRALVSYGSSPSKASVHHNLVERTRQSGLDGSEVFHNEVYIDSWATNSFGVRVSDGGKAQGNRIFGGGYHVCGIGWGSNLTVAGNLIHLQGRKPTGRSSEYGDHESLNGIRLTQYAGGEHPYENNLYENNVIVVRGRDGCQMRGVQFFSDPFVKNLVFRDNIVKAIAEDEQTTQAACVVTQGLHERTPDHQPILYQNNTFIANVLHVRFGDYYGVGSNHRFVGCRLERVGDDPRYRTFAFGTGYPCKNHVVRDGTFADGAAPDSVTWSRRDADQDYTVQWTLTVKTLPGAAVTIADRTGAEVFSGRAGDDGTVSAPATQFKATPAGTTAYTPHTVTAEKDGRTTQQKVTVDRTTQVTVMP